MKKEIGGFFQLELPQEREYYSDCIRLNTARNAFEYLIRARNYIKIYLPKYMCDSMIEPLKRNHIEYEFFSIDNDLLPLIDSKKIKQNIGILVTNYFGLLDNKLSIIKEKYKNLIIDNSQAFFSTPLNNIDTIYSPRKFFGVPDGSYLFTSQSINENFPQSISWNNSDYLIKRIDLSANEAYNDFKKNEERLTNKNIERMSNLTRKLLESINYTKVKDKRNENFLYLHKRLRSHNELTPMIECGLKNTPLVYPFLTNKDRLRENLINKNIYVAQYWKDVFKRSEKNEWEFYLSKFLLPLPIDQRYGRVEMDYISKIINN